MVFGRFHGTARSSKLFQTFEALSIAAACSVAKCYSSPPISGNFKRNLSSPMRLEHDLGQHRPSSTRNRKEHGCLSPRGLYRIFSFSASVERSTRNCKKILICSATINHRFTFSGVTCGGISTFPMELPIIRMPLLREGVPTCPSCILFFSLSNYVMFEVLETSWGILQENLNSALTMDEIMEAHNSYLSGIMVRALLHEDSTYVADKLNEVRSVY